MCRDAADLQRKPAIRARERERKRETEMYENETIRLGRTGQDGTNGSWAELAPEAALGHGLILGAEQSGKYETVRMLVESFSEMGVPVFLTDRSGDFSGMTFAGEPDADFLHRLSRLGLSEETYAPQGFPTALFDVLGKRGIPLRTTVSEIGPKLMAGILELTELQTDILGAAYQIADEEGLLLFDLKDLKALLQYVLEKSGDYAVRYGKMSAQSLNAIIRAIAVLEAKGGNMFLGEPAFQVADFFSGEREGLGTINILDAVSIRHLPELYGAFVLYLLSELSEFLPETGGENKLRMICLIDQAGLLFRLGGKELSEEISGVFAELRRKGVAVWLIGETAAEIPAQVRAGLGFRMLHAVSPYMATDRKALKAMKGLLLENPAFNIEETLLALKSGEALISMTDAAGVPAPAERVALLPPRSFLKALSSEEREEQLQLSGLFLKYRTAIDPDSAYEFLMRRKLRLSEEAAQEKAELLAEKERVRAEKEAERLREREAREAEKERLRTEREAEREEERERKALARGMRNVASVAAGSVGRELGHTVGEKLGGRFGKTFGGNIGASIGRNLLGTLFRR